MANFLSTLHPFLSSRFKQSLAFLAVCFLLVSCASIDEKMQRHIQEGKYNEAIQAGETFISKKPGTPEARAVLDLLMEAEFKQTQTLNTIDAYDAYQHKFPHHPYKKELIEAEFQLYKQMNTLKGFDEFDKKFPRHSFTTELVEAEYLLYKQMNTLEGFDEFDRKFPDHPYKKELVESEFTLYKTMNTIAGYDEFNVKFPDHPYKKELVESEYALYKAIDTLEGYETFDKKFPEHPFKNDLMERQSLVYYRTVTLPKNSAAAFRDFKTRFPASSLISEATEKEKQALAAEAEAGWAMVVQSNTVDAYDMFCSSYPESVHVAEAREKICDLAWKEAETANTLEAFLMFKNNHGACVEKVKLAESRAEEMVWNDTVTKNTPEAFETFCEQYPASPRVNEARARATMLLKKKKK